MNFKITVFPDMTSCSLVRGYSYLREQRRPIFYQEKTLFLGHQAMALWNSQANFWTHCTVGANDSDIKEAIN